MKIGVLGSGPVGKALSRRLSELDHLVMISTRDAQKLGAWRSSNQKVKVGSFEDAAIHGELIFNATSGSGTLEALKMAGEANLNGKILVDISNPLDFSNGFPHPCLSATRTL